MQRQDKLVSSCLTICFRSVYIPFYIAQSKSSTPSINVPMIANPPAAASTSTQPPLISGRKQKKQDPLLHPKASKVPKPDPGVDVDEANDAIGEEMNDFDFESVIPEDFIPQTESSHTKRRRRNANAWQEVMPALIHPLMAALHAIAPNNTDRVIEVEAFACISGCQIRRSTVKIVSFGGM
jgi:hypothetical protein